VTDLSNIEHVSNRQHDAMIPSRSCLVHPVDRFDTEGWFSSDHVIFLTVSFFGEKACSICKNAISGFPVSPGSAEALVR